MVGQHWCEDTYFQNLPPQITKIIEAMLVSYL